MSEPLTADAVPSPAAEPPKGALKIIFFIVMMDFIGFGIIIPLLPFYVPGYDPNSLTQTLLKYTAPGMPDLYQGAELWDLSLVDPDNRRPVDYGDPDSGGLGGFGGALTVR